LIQTTFKPPLIENLLFPSVKNAGLETETKNKIKTETEKNSKPVLISKPKPEKKIGYRYYN